MSTLGQRVNAGYLGANECHDLRELRATGLSIREIANLTDRRKRTVRRHVEGECSHGGR